MTDNTYTHWEPCPACKTPVGFDPYDGIPATFGVPFKCPHCGVGIELSGEDVEQADGDYEWEYEFERAAVTVSASTNDEGIST
jgi:hypothetical protein